MSDLKTTFFGLVAALAGFVLYSPEYFPAVVVDLAKYVMIGGFAGLGITAAQVKKDNKKDGGV